MAVEISWSEEADGTPTVTKKDHGTVTNGNSTNPTTQLLVFSHDHSANITGVTLFAEEYGSGYVDGLGSFGSSDDFAELVGWGDGSGTTFGGVQVQMNYNGGTEPADQDAPRQWPTSANKGPNTTVPYGFTVRTDVGDSSAATSPGVFRCTTGYISGTKPKVAATEVWQVDISPAGENDVTTDFNDSGDTDVLPFPASEAIGDYFAIGYAERFDSLVINNGASTAGVGGTVAWEYSTGQGTWAALTILLDETEEFTVTAGGGLGADNKQVTWTMPTDWAKTTVSTGASLYYVRARVTGTYSTNPVLDQGYIQGPDGIVGPGQKMGFWSRVAVPSAEDTVGTRLFKFSLKFTAA